eukprot:COSAG01_NODE_3745_length_5742_cov_18.618901_1_plen_254_part_10
MRRFGASDGGGDGGSGLLSGEVSASDAMAFAGAATETEAFIRDEAAELRDVDLHSPTGVLGAAEGAAGRAAAAVNGRCPGLLRQARAAKVAFDEQTSGRAIALADGVLRASSRKLESRAAKTAGSGFLLGVSGTLGGIADQAAGPLLALQQAAGTAPPRVPATSPPPIPTKEQVAKSLEAQRQLSADAKDAYVRGGGGGVLDRGLTKPQVRELVLSEALQREMESLRLELAGLKLSGLRKRALALGVAEASLDD